MRATAVIACLVSACAADPTGLGRIDAEVTVDDARVAFADAFSPDATSPDAAFVADPDASDPDAFAADAGAVSPDAAAAPDATPATIVRYPIVLLHGWAASDTVLGLTAVGADLTRAGHRVLVAAVPPFDSAEIRATFLRDQVDQLLRDTGAAKVNIIAHSMGGLDSRHLITGLGYGDRVASLSTIGTPHRGTAVADVILGLQSGASTAAVDALGAIFGARVSDVESDPQVRASLRALSEDAALTFNPAHPDDPRVFYQSWAGLSNVRGIPSRNDEVACETLLFDATVRDVMDRALVPLAAMAAHGLRIWPNDGLVPVVSAKWGVYHGCVPADHADEVGAFDDVPPDAVTGFDFLAFYRSIALDLAMRGF